MGAKYDWAEVNKFNLVITAVKPSPGHDRFYSK